MPRRRLRPTPVWRRPDAHSLLPLSRDWVQTRRALDRQAAAGGQGGGPAAVCCDSDPLAICHGGTRLRACPSWSSHMR